MEYGARVSKTVFFLSQNQEVGCVSNIHAYYAAASHYINYTVFPCGQCGISWRPRQPHIQFFIWLPHKTPAPPPPTTDPTLRNTLWPDFSPTFLLKALYLAHFSLQIWRNLGSFRGGKKMASVLSTICFRFDKVKTFHHLRESKQIPL